MTTERETRRQWTGGAARQHFGRCDDCGSTHDADSKPLLVARQARSRKFQCLNCFAIGLLTRSQRQALLALTMADDAEIISRLADGSVRVSVGESREQWTITRRGKRERVEA
jgi:hypothetical protein